jgi:hypothetical protein
VIVGWIGHHFRKRQMRVSFLEGHTAFLEGHTETEYISMIQVFLLPFISSNSRQCNESIRESLFREKRYQG